MTEMLSYIQLFEIFVTWLETKMSFGTSYHLEIDGPIERTRQVTKVMLKCGICNYIQERNNTLELGRHSGDGAMEALSLEEATWELEEVLRKKYPGLFSKAMKED